MPCLYKISKVVIASVVVLSVSIPLVINGCQYLYKKFRPKPDPGDIGANIYEIVKLDP
jgi:hypothetical protein